MRGHRGVEMIWTGETMEVEIVKRAGMAGRFESDETKKVFAIKNPDGPISVLVADDDGALTWVDPPNYRVVFRVPLE